MGGKVALHPAIGQHRGNGTFRPGDSTPLPVEGNEGDQDVTINRSPSRIDNDTAICVAIECDPEVGTVRAHLLAERGGVGGANAIIDNAVPHRKR
jgi:hypothetical protein